MGRELNLKKAEKVHTSASGSTYGRANEDLFGHARASSIDPLMNGEAEVGTDDGYFARGDHRHPTDLTRQPVTLNTPIVVNGTSRSTVEEVLNALNSYVDTKSSDTLNVNITVTKLDGTTETETTVNDALTGINDTKQNQRLSSSIEVDENICTNVEDTLNALNNYSSDIDSRMQEYEGKLITLLDDLEFSINENGELLLTY